MGGLFVEQIHQKTNFYNKKLYFFDVLFVLQINIAESHIECGGGIIAIMIFDIQVKMYIKVNYKIT